MLMYSLSTSRKTLMTLALLSLCALGQAQELRWYDVEVIAFAHARGEYLNTETWPQQWPQPDTQSAINFTTLNHSLFSQKKPQGALSGIAARVDKSSRYQLLNYKVWRQAGLAETKAKAVHIQSEAQISSLVPQGLDEYGNPISELIEVPMLDGTIRISLGRFLHIHTDLVYTTALEDIQQPPETAVQADVAIQTTQRLAPKGAQQNRLQGFVLKTQRKTRSKETQFIDHPMFGLIVRITPVKTS